MTLGNKYQKKRIIYKKRKGKKSVNKASKVSFSSGMGAAKPLALNTITYQKGYSPFGNRYMVRLPYCSDFTIVAAAGSTFPSIQKFRLNSLYDPDLTGVGHQPRWFNQLEEMYATYRVNSVKVHCTFNDPGLDGLYVGINVYNNDQVTHNTVLGRDLENIRERRITTVHALNNTGNQTKTLSFSMPISKILGLTKTQHSTSPATMSNKGTNPSQVAILEVFCMAPFVASQIGVSVSIKIEYCAEMFDYESPPMSN